MTYRIAPPSCIGRILIALQLLLLPVVRIGEIFDEDFDDIAQLAR